MMKNIFNIRLLFLVCLCISMVLTTPSCKKDNDTTSRNVKLLSFGPTGVQHGDTLIFIGTNFDKVTAVKLVGDSIPSSSFIKHTASIIQILVPDDALAGFVTLTSPEGDVVSKTKLDFEVQVSITTGPESAKPGENITFTGKYLDWITSVTFFNNVTVKAIDFVSQSLTKIVIKVPLNAQTGKVVITTAGTKPMIMTSTNDLILTLPAITDFAPVKVDRGSDITITGSDVDLTYGILFKNATDTIKTFVSKSQTKLVVTVPQSAASGKFKLITYSGIVITSETSLGINGDLPAVTPLSYLMYEDALINGWGDWSGISAKDFANSENVRDGSASIKANFSGSWGTLTFGGGSIATDTYSVFSFSMFGSPESTGQQMGIVINENWGGPYIFTILEGWNEYNINLTDLGSPNPLTRIDFQDRGWSGLIYLDHVGLK